LNEKQNGTFTTEENSYFFQIDFLKALMIFLVIFDHTISWTIKDVMGVQLWERISIPVFLIIVGFNFGNSNKSKGIDEFNKNYVARKFTRFIIPFLIIYVVSTFIGIFFYGFDLQAMFSNQNSPYGLDHLFLGIFPFWGPGSWFFPLLFGSILLLPIIYKGFSKNTLIAFISLMICFAFDIGMHLIFYSQFKVKFFVDGTIDLNSYISYAYTFLSIVLPYISALGLGMWISRDPHLFSWRNIIIWLLFIPSLLYLIAYQFFDFRILDSNGVSFLTGDYHFLAFPYSAFLVLVAIKILPKQNTGKVKKFISIIGRSTYHILLTQTFYFAILIAIRGSYECTSLFGVSLEGLGCVLHLCLNWAICIPIGILWWFLENSVRLLIKHRKGF